MLSVLAASWISSTYTDKNSRFAWSKNKHSQFRTFPNRVPIELSQIAFSISILPKGDRTDFLSRGTTGSSMDDDFDHLCFGRRIQISGHSDFGILNNVDGSSILTGCKLILRLLLVLRILVALI